MPLTDDLPAQLRLAEFDRLVTGVRSWVETAPLRGRRWIVRGRCGPGFHPGWINCGSIWTAYWSWAWLAAPAPAKARYSTRWPASGVCPAGDVERPTTRRPVVLAHPDVDVSTLEFNGAQPEVHRLALPMLEKMILIDCPDPDTQSRNGSGGEAAPTHNNQNLEMLRRILPQCDVLLCTGTAQKYKTHAVADELLRHAPGRQAVFVQTHAAVDADITADWQRQLQSQGFDVPKMFRLDTEEALERIEQHRPLPPEFARLVDFLNSELAGRARHRILRANALDLLAWFLDEVQHDINASSPAIAKLDEAIQAERARLFDSVRRHLDEQLRGHQGVWRARLLREVTLRWSWGPFSAFLRLLGSARSWLNFFRRCEPADWRRCL